MKISSTITQVYTVTILSKFIHDGRPCNDPLIARCIYFQGEDIFPHEFFKLSMFYKCHVKHIFTNISWESTLFSDMNQEFVSSVPSIFIVLWYDMIKLDMIWIDDAAEYEKISVMKIIHTRKESLALLWNPEVWYLISNIWNIWYEIFDICYEIQRFDKLLVLRPFIHTVPLPCQGNSLNDHVICNKSIDLKKT